jgi:hypothetical protein
MLPMLCRRVCVSTIVSACLLVAAIALPQAGHSSPQAADPSAENEYVLRTIYFIPTNREPNPESVEKLKNYVKLLNQYYGMQMARHGFYKPGTTEGKTFAYEVDEHGEPLIRIHRGKMTDAEYGGGPELFGRVRGEIAEAFSMEKATYYVMAETARIHPDSTITGPCCLGARGRAPGGAGGIAIKGSDNLPFLDAALFDDDTPVEGMIIPELGPYPVKHGVSFGGYAGNTVGDYASTILGATGHEIGHAFNLPHVFSNDHGAKTGGDLMGLGNQGFRGNFGNFPGEWAHLSRESCEMLNVYRVFNPGEPLTHSEPPKHVLTAVLENPTASMGKNIRVQVEASDSGAGLYRTFALVTPPWTTVKSAGFDEDGMADFSIDSWEVPRQGLPPRSYNLEVLTLDNMGNWALAATWVPVPETVLQQCQDGDGWRNLPSGSWSDTHTMRMVISMTTLQNDVVITPEVEVRPVGTPFAGRPNFTGEGVHYTGSPVTGYVDVQLRDGSYHWQYRLTTSTGEISSWVSFGTHDPQATDFRIVTRGR